jgi:hypothetical protein
MMSRWWWQWCRIWGRGSDADGKLMAGLAQGRVTFTRMGLSLNLGMHLQVWLTVVISDTKC